MPEPLKRQKSIIDGRPKPKQKPIPTFDLLDEAKTVTEETCVDFYLKLMQAYDAELILSNCVRACLETVVERVHKTRYPRKKTPTLGKIWLTSDFD